MEKARELGVPVGGAAWKALSSEGYLIRCSAGVLLLAGKTELSVFYAVEKFLEKHLGVRWFMPGEIGEVVPSSPTVRIGEIEEVGEPGFRWRWVGKGEWARRNGMNVAVDCDGEFKTEGFVHTFMKLLPPEQYLDRHPEYYALVGGKRGERQGEKGQIQLCTSNPEVATEVAARIVKMREADPSLKMISLDPMDTQAFCECPNCRALDEPGASAHNALARRMLLFYNAVSGLVRLKVPDLLLKSIAYHKYVAPPLERTLKLNDNSVIQVCRFMCHNHALSDPDCPYNRAYHEYLMGWREIAAHVALYEYYYKVSWLELPWPIVHTLRKDIPDFHKLGLFGLATQYGENFGSNGLVYYVAARLLWEPGLDVDALVEDFYTKFYAEAAGPMRQYYEALEEAAVASGVHLARQSSYEEVVRLFTPDLLARLDGFVACAEKAARDDRVKARIELARTSLEYAKICAEYLRALQKVRHEGDLPWAVGTVAQKAQAVGAPYVGKIKAALEKGRKIRATKGAEGGYIERLLDPAQVVRSWDRPDLGFGEMSKSTQKRAWLSAASGRKAVRAPLPARVSVWVVGYDFDSDGKESECQVWTVSPAGRRVDIGGLAPAGDSGNRADRCYVFHGLAGSEVIGDRARAALIISNPAGHWTDATLFAAYVLPDEPGLASREAMRRTVEDLDGVRSRALGFVEFDRGGLFIPDGADVGLEIDLNR